MSSNTQISNNSGKPSLGLPSLLPQPVPQPSNSSLTGNDPQRRSGVGPGGGGSAAPRNCQSSRKGHRNHRKPDTSREIDIEEQMASSGRRKGTSITHLINWSVAVPHSSSYKEIQPRITRRAPTWGPGSGYHAVDKARYVNSNYRFIVNPRGDYRPQTVDSDIHLPWDHILQILVSARTQFSKCPICISTPVAPRMAKCGHIFCLPCLIRYMVSDDSETPSDKKPRYKKCVICTDSVYMQDVRPVRFFTGQQNEPPKEGEDIVLRLMARKRGSTLALPRDGSDMLDGLEEIPWHFAAEVMDYARVIKGTEDYVMEQFGREIEELVVMQQEDEQMYGEEGFWAKKAINTIRTHMEGISGMGNPPRPVIKARKDKLKEKQPSIEFNETAEDVPDMYYALQANSGGSSQSHTPSVLKSDKPTKMTPTNGIPEIGIEPAIPILPVNAADSSFFFYQALLHYYLSPLDIRILKSAFGSFAAFPSNILPRVENVSTGHLVDDNLRKRARYLAHLPSGCEVNFLECDWTDIVPPQIIEKFKPEIDRRRNIKREKELKEERDRIRAEKLNDEERWAALRQQRQAPFIKEQFRDEDFVSLADADQGVLHPDCSDHHDEGPGFSVRSSNAPPPSPPQFKSATQARTVWGTPLVASNRDTLVQQNGEDSAGWLPNWEKELLLEENMLSDIDMENVSSRNRGEGVHRGVNGPGRSGGGKGQKKLKKVTLISNGGKRGA